MAERHHGELEDQTPNGHLDVNMIGRGAILIHNSSRANPGETRRRRVLGVEVKLLLTVKRVTSRAFILPLFTSTLPCTVVVGVIIVSTR